MIHTNNKTLKAEFDKENATLKEENAELKRRITNLENSNKASEAMMLLVSKITELNDARKKDTDSLKELVNQKFSELQDTEEVDNQSIASSVDSTH